MGPTHFFRLGVRGIATDKHAVHNFKRILSEFEKMDFSKAQPLTQQGIPWPILIDLSKPNLDLVQEITADNVLPFAQRWRKRLGGLRNQEFFEIFDFCSTQMAGAEGGFLTASLMKASAVR